MKNELPYRPSALVDRLHTIYDPESSPLRRVVDDPNFLPKKTMKLSRISPLDTFLKLVKKTGEFHVEKKPMRAKNLSAYCVSLAEQLTTQLSSQTTHVDIHTASSILAGVECLWHINPSLAEDVARFMQIAEDTNRFSNNRK